MDAIATYDLRSRSNHHRTGVSKMSRTLPVLLAAILLSFSLAACGDDGTEADQIGVGAQCADDGECAEEANCLTRFSGGYCGLSGCQSNADCPQGSACVTHDDGNNYCFRICTNKAECNRNRSEANAANCSSNVTFTDADFSGKACVPPSS